MERLTDNKRSPLGRDVHDLDSPVAILDLSALKRNCNRMLESVKALEVRFRAHVKTHKTVELAQLQVVDSADIRLVVSTVAELEHMWEWLLHSYKAGRSVDVIYGVPPTRSSVRRLNQLREEIKTSVGGTQATFQICLLVDNVESLAFKELSPDPFSFYIKIDCGYNRAGVIVPSENWNKLLHHLQSNSKYADKLQGLYTHFGTSYGGNSPSEALRGLTKEIEALVEPAKSLKRTLSDLHHIVLSVGATPTATSIQNFSEISFSTEVAEFCQRTKKLRADGFLIEIHAGVYPTLDLQQLATRARSKLSGLSHHDIALTIQVEVVGRYFRNGKHEALVAAGSLALGREPCKSYPGWGVVVPRKRDGQFYSEDNAKGWIVGRISQEHGILVWEDPAGGAPLEPDDIFIGDILRIWPNHACIAGAMFDQYVVVDSDSNELEIIDIWNRCRGW